MRRSSTPRGFFAASFVLGVDAASAGHLFPALAEATHAAARDTTWFLTAYMMGALLGAPALAGQAAAHGRVRVIAASLLAFALASLVVGAAPSFALTLGGRFVQGLGGSVVLPLASAHVGATVDPHVRGREVSKLSLAYAAGFLVGIVGVSLVLLVSFRIAFVAIALAAGGVALGVARDAGAEAERGGQAPKLAVLVPWTLALGVSAFAVSTATLGASGLAVRAARFAALPLLALFLLVDRRSVTPLLPRRFLGSAQGLATAALALVAGLGQAGVVALPSFAVTLLGVSPAASGPLLAPIVVGGVSANVLASARLDRWGATRFALGGGLGVALGAAAVALGGGTILGFEAATLLLGTGVSLLSTGALRVLAMQAGAAEEADARQAAVSLLTNVGLLLGGALWGATAEAAATPRASAGLGFVALAVAAAIPLGIGAALLASRREPAR